MTTPSTPSNTSTSIASMSTPPLATTTTSASVSASGSSSATPGHPSSSRSTTANTTTTPTASFFDYPGTSSPPPSTPNIAPLPSCLMPDTFMTKGDLEDYLQQFNTAAFLSGWYSTAHDNSPNYFALRLRGNALHFYATLSAAQQTLIC